MDELFSIQWEGRVVAMIDADGNFTCSDKVAMVKALKAQGAFWLEVTDRLADLSRPRSV